MSDQKRLTPPGRLKAALTPSDTQLPGGLKPHRHAAITTKISTYHRYKMWEEKMRSIPKEK